MTENTTLIKTKLIQPISSCSLSKQEIRALLEKIESHIPTAIQLEEASYTDTDRQLPNFDELSESIRSAFKVSVTVRGTNGEELFGSIAQVFDSPNFPEIVESVFLFSDTHLKVDCNHTPRNKVTLHLDFKKPKLLDFQIIPSFKTPNASNFEIEGYDSGWVNGVFSEINTFLEIRTKSSDIIHRQSIYDGFLWIFGWPMVFYICYKASTLISSVFDSNQFLKSAVYLYLGYAVLILMRIVFHYARWVFPKIEYDSKFNKPIRHRVFLTAIVLGLIGSFIYDILKSVG